MLIPSFWLFHFFARKLALFSFVIEPPPPSHRSPRMPPHLAQVRRAGQPGGAATAQQDSRAVPRVGAAGVRERWPLERVELGLCWVCGVVCRRRRRRASGWVGECIEWSTQHSTVYQRVGDFVAFISFLLPLEYMPTNFDASLYRHLPIWHPNIM